MVTFDEACIQFESLFQIAARGEMVIIKRDDQQVALKNMDDNLAGNIAPPGYFAGDYSSQEISELNTLASQAPHLPLS